MFIQRSLHVLPPKIFFIIIPSLNSFAKGVHSMKQRVSVTSLQKQIRKCNEIFILQKKFQTDVLEQAWSPNKLLTC